jgi:hypothetical protein
MEIKGKVHCFFEQSGTFKQEFIKLGIPAEDYDIQNNFGETDHQDDLFKEIENAYDDKPSIFDNITKDDLIVAFFPCIYFSALSQMSMYWTCVNYRKKTMKEKTDLILERSHNREYFFSLAVKMLAVAQIRGLRLIMENPWSEQTFLKANFVMAPTLVDMDRTKRGDFFKKPTAYFFINCEPLDGETRQQSKVVKNILSSKSSGQAGLCSEDRSMISHDYARNWICDFILGIKQPDVDQNYGEALF